MKYSKDDVLTWFTRDKATIGASGWFFDVPDTFDDIQEDFTDDALYGELGHTSESEYTFWCKNHSEGWRYFLPVKLVLRQMTIDEWLHVMLAETPVRYDGYTGKIQSISKNSITHSTGHICTEIKLKDTLKLLTWEDGTPCGVEYDR